MAHSPLISVIVPAYNTRGTIAETLDSVLAQTFKDYEIIVVDDGSPDDVAAFVSREYPGVKLVRQANRGLAGARNAGMRAAAGEWVAFVDSDDVWLPEKLALQAGQIKAHPGVEVFYSNCFFWRDGVRTGRWSDIHGHQDGAIAQELIGRHVMLPVLTVVARREAVLAAGGFDEGLREVEDYDLWLRLAVAGSRFAYLDRPTALYRQSPAGMSNDLLQMARTQLAVYRKLAANPAASEFRADIEPQIKAFRLEVLHQQRRAAAVRGDRLGVAAGTLKMAGVDPAKAPRFVAAAALALARPQKYR